MLTVDYLTEADLARYRSDDWINVLGIARLGVSHTGFKAKVPVARVEAKSLGEPLIYEVWRAAEPLHNFKIGDIECRSNGQLLFGRIAIQESGTLWQATEGAYDQIFVCLRDAGLPHLLRVWNYMSHINEENDGVERYRQFNAARQKSFKKYGDLFSEYSCAGYIPAACAIGTGGNTALSIYFIASVVPPIAIENPRQVPAYDYPAEYGDFRPLFSRATLLKTTSAMSLFISGTSSIIGHSTVGAGNVLAQTRETLANLRSLMDTVNDNSEDAHIAIDKLRLKIYLRDSRDQDVVAAELARQINSKFPATYLQADICRADLAVEIEAFGALA